MATTGKSVIEMGVSAFTLLDLLRRVATYKGLKFWKGCANAQSEVFKYYSLDHETLALLARNGIRKQGRPDGVFTLVDENPQKEVKGWAPSNYWNFWPPRDAKPGQGKLDLRIGLSAGFCIKDRARGIILVPLAHGTCLSPSDHLPNFRMFKALTDNDPNAIFVAREIAASDGAIVVSWTELGLGGIRSISTLFAEFAGKNEYVQRLGRVCEVFDPLPYPCHQQPGDEVYVVEPAQPNLFEAWDQQLKDYRGKLAVA